MWWLIGGSVLLIVCGAISARAFDRAMDAAGPEGGGR
jgi:hypothetical protein